MNNRMSNIDLMDVAKAKDEAIKKISKKYTILTPELTNRVLDASTINSDVFEYKITAVGVDVSFMRKNHVDIKNWVSGGKYYPTVLNNMQDLDLVQAPIKRIQKEGFLKIGQYILNLDIFCLDKKGTVNPNKFPRYFMKDNIIFNASPEAIGAFGGLYE
jgi:hypothetical protein